MTTASAPIACRVSAVSLRLSPLDTLEPLAEKLITSARQALRRRLERDPGPGRVLVEQVDHGAAAQRRQLLDLAAGHRGHLGGGVEHGGRVGAVQIGRASRWRIPSAFMRRSFPVIRTSSRAVDLGQQHPHVLVQRGRDVLAHVVGPDRQLPVAAVDQDGELDHARPAEVGQRVERGPDRAAGEEHVVDQDHPAAVDAGRGQVGRTERPGAAQAQVVAVERDVERRRPGPRGPRRRGSGRPAGGPAAHRGSGCRAGRSRGRRRSSRGSDARSGRRCGPDRRSDDDLAAERCLGSWSLTGLDRLRVGQGGPPSPPHWTGR